MQAKLKNLKISPRKVRLVADMIRGKSTANSIKILNFTVKRAKSSILKLLNSAIANSKNMKVDSDLYIKEIRVDKGPILKRSMPRSKGMANPIMKRTSHILIVLDKIEILNKKIQLKKEKAEKIKNKNKPKN